MRKGQVHTTATRLKMRLARLGKSPANKGKKMWANKVHPNLGKVGWNRVEMIERICIGCKLTFKVKSYFKYIYCSKPCANKYTKRFANGGSFKKGMTSWRKGKIGLPYVSHPRMSQYREDTHWSWKGGISRNTHSLSEPRYKEWRMRVFIRDGFKCRMATEDCREVIQAHHILRWAEYVELRYEINNGITLCLAHHPRKRAEEKRLAPQFQELVAVSKDSN